MTVIREPAVAGQFYPADRVELERTVADLLDGAKTGENDAPKALIAPHAGYIYSGPIAARAYVRLRPHRDTYERVVLLGPCHHVPVRGMALSSAEAFRTPMGDVFIDTDALEAIDTSRIKVFDETHEFEHSLEVHLPFLQAVLGDFKLIPVIVGNTKPERVAELLDALWGGPETLIVISSDLSHYHSYDEARHLDGGTRQAIEDLEIRGIDHDTACGATPIGGLLIHAKRRGMAVTTLDLRNSGDTAGDRRHVVGYGSWMFLEQ